MKPRRVSRDRTPNIADRESVSLFNGGAPLSSSRDKGMPLSSSRDKVMPLSSSRDKGMPLSSSRDKVMPLSSSRVNRRIKEEHSSRNAFGSPHAQMDPLVGGTHRIGGSTRTIAPNMGKSLRFSRFRVVGSWEKKNLESQDLRSSPASLGKQSSLWGGRGESPYSLAAGTAAGKKAVPRRGKKVSHAAGRQPSPSVGESAPSALRGPAPSTQEKREQKRETGAEKKRTNKSRIDPNRRYLSKNNLLRFILVLVFGSILTKSAILTLPLSFAAFALPTLLARRKYERARLELVTSWPEILDLMISGLHSGLSIAETIHGLADRGPEATRPLFTECKAELVATGDLDKVLELIKSHFHDAMADQVCEVLDFARSTGSRDTTLTLRTLGEYIRSEIALREEIRVKHGWIRNSAAVASVAPWILLAVLSLQPNTMRAYSSGAGVLVLLMGVGMCAVAFLWMNKVGRMPEIPRVFE